MFKYKTYLDFQSKTFKFEPGLNVIIPLFDDLHSTSKPSHELFIEEFNDYFSEVSSLNDSDILYFNLNSIEDLYKINTKNIKKKVFILIDGSSINFMFLPLSTKLTFRMQLAKLIKESSNEVYIIFLTDDYSFLNHSRSMLLSNSRVVRNFKNYDAFIKFMTKGLATHNEVFKQQ